MEHLSDAKTLRVLRDLLYAFERHGSTLIMIDHSDEFSELLFDESGALHPVILFIVNDVPAAPNQALNDGEQVQVFSPVAGG